MALGVPPDSFRHGADLVGVAMGKNTKEFLTAVPGRQVPFPDGPFDQVGELF